MATTPTPPAAQGTPNYAAAAGNPLAAPWSASGLTALGISGGGIGDLQDKEHLGMSVYKGQIMPTEQAAEQYDRDMLAYQKAQAAQGGANGKAPIRPKYQDFLNAAASGTQQEGDLAEAPQSGDVVATAQANYKAAMQSYNDQLAQWQGQNTKGNTTQLDQLTAGSSGQPGAAPVNPTLAQVITQQFDMMNSDQITNLQRRMQAAGFITQKYTPGIADSNTVKSFASLLMTTNQNLAKDPGATWTSVLQNAVNQSGWKVLPNGDMQRTVEKSPPINPLAAQQAFNQAVGRNASASEIQAFTDHYNAVMAQHPLDSTETLSKAGIDTTSAPTYAIQGATIQQAELEAAQQNPDYATYQAATTYWNAMQQALGAQGQVENNLK